MWSGPQEYVPFEFDLTSPVVSRVSISYIYIYIYIYMCVCVCVCVCVCLSFKHVWLNNKDTFLSINFIKIVSSFLISVLVLGWNWEMNLSKLSQAFYKKKHSLHEQTTLHDSIWKVRKPFSKIFITDYGAYFRCYSVRGGLYVVWGRELWLLKWRYCWVSIGFGVDIFDDLTIFVSYEEHSKW